MNADQTGVGLAPVPVPVPVPVPHRRLSRRERRISETRGLIVFMNENKQTFSAGDEKNGQGLWVIYAILKMTQISSRQSGRVCDITRENAWLGTNRTSFSLYEVAKFIRKYRIWFKPPIQLLDEGEPTERFALVSETSACEPYKSSKASNVKEDIIYMADVINRNGRSNVTNIIMNQIKSCVITPRRSHDIIRSLISSEGQKEFRVVFTEVPPPTNILSSDRAAELNRSIRQPHRELPPSNLTAEKSKKLNRIMRMNDYSDEYTTDQAFFDCW